MMIRLPPPVNRRLEGALSGGVPVTPLTPALLPIPYVPNICYHILSINHNQQPCTEVAYGVHRQPTRTIAPNAA